MTNKNNQYNNKINKQKEIEQNRRKKKKSVAIIIILLVAVTGICIYLLTAEKFNIDEIIIEGNNRLTYEEICEIAEIEKGENIFSKLGIVIKVKLKQNGNIKEAKIEKIFPSTVKIAIEERTEQYQILTESGVYIYIDEQGYILDYGLDKLELHTITGMEINENEIDEINRLTENDLKKMENVLHIESEFKNIEINENIQQIDTENEYIIHLENDKYIVNLGNATNLKNRMLYVKAMLKEEEKSSGTIYVNGNINEGFVPYFSEK